jgi:hypothetical protein
MNEDNQIADQAGSTSEAGEAFVPGDLVQLKSGGIVMTFGRYVSSFDMAGDGVIAHHSGLGEIRSVTLDPAQIMRAGGPEQLSASEALFGFTGWLTTRAERTVMSGKDYAGPIAELVQRFCDENSLVKPRDGWPRWLKHPAEPAGAGEPLLAPESDAWPRKYRKRAVVIQAKQFAVGGNPEEWPEGIEWGGDLPEGTGGYIVMTPEGPAGICHGDWVITWPSGERRPCRPATFAATYEPEVGARVCCAPGCGKAAEWSAWPERARGGRPDYCEPLTCSEHLAEYGMTFALGEEASICWHVFPVETLYGPGTGVSAVDPPTPQTFRERAAAPVVTAMPIRWDTLELMSDFQLMGGHGPVASEGDYVIRGDGALYTCKPDVFEATFEPIQEDKGGAPMTDAAITAALDLATAVSAKGTGAITDLCMFLSRLGVRGESLMRYFEGSRDPVTGWAATLRRLQATVSVTPWREIDRLAMELRGARLQLADSGRSFHEAVLDREAAREGLTEALDELERFLPQLLRGPGERAMLSRLRQTAAGRHPTDGRSAFVAASITALAAPDFEVREAAVMALERLDKLAGKDAIEALRTFEDPTDPRLTEYARAAARSIADAEPA